MAYTQNFKSLGGTIYTVNVPNASPSDTPPLAAVPFETEEDGETDMFKPVRTQSGYLRMVSTDLASWRAFIPANAVAQPIFLTSSGNVLWCGYIQTGTYGMAWPATFEDIEMPLICPLSILDSYDIEASPSGLPQVVTIGQLLNYIFSKITGFSFTIYVNFHASATSYVNNWLNYKILWRNLLDDNDGLAGRFSCLQVLEELCKFFGWTCRMCGNNIYFTSITDAARNGSFQCCTIAALANSSRTFESPVSMSVVSITNQFADNSQDEEYIPGCKSATVNAELNPYDVLEEVPDDDIQKQYKYNTPVLGERERWSTQNVEEYFLIQPNNGQSTYTYEDADVKIESRVITPVTQAAGFEGACYGRLIISDYNTHADEKRSWRTFFECFRGKNHAAQTSLSTPLFSIESQSAYIITGGVIYIKFKGEPGAESVFTLPIPMQALCMLRIGTSSSDYKYWNGSSWVSESALSTRTFTLTFDKDGVIDTATSSSAIDYEGYGASLDNVAMLGKVYFAVIDVIPTRISDVLSLNGYLPLVDLEIGIERLNEDTEVNDVNYNATGGAFPEKVTVDTIFCTDKTKTISGKSCKCQLGYGMLFSDTGVVDTIAFGSGVTQKPEQRMANLIAAYGQQVKRSVSLNLRTDLIGSVTPANTCSFDGSTSGFYPIAINHSWRDDITTLKLMQKQ